MYQAVVYGIEEQLTGDVREAVVAFWHSTVEPFFGRGQRTYQQLHTKTELQQLEAEEHAKASSSSEQVSINQWLVVTCLVRLCNSACAFQHGGSRSLVDCLHCLTTRHCGHPLMTVSQAGLACLGLAVCLWRTSWQIVVVNNLAGLVAPFALNGGWW